MRAFLISAACLIPSAALAQPYQQPQPQPPPPQPYPQQPQPYPQQPQPQYQQPYGQQPMYPQQPVNHRSGITFEANLGLGYLYFSSDGYSDSSELGIGGLSIGLGGWANDKLAITGRLAGVTLSDPGVRLSGIFLGPSAQFWNNDHLWFGAGAGLAILAVSADNGNGDSITGFGLDLRVGYTFTSGGPSTFNASFELTPGFYSDDSGDSGTMTGVGFLLGYQYL